MGLMSRLQRWKYVYGWRLRYWWLDTPSGTQAQVVVFSLAVLTIIVELIRVTVAALAPRSAHAPQQAFYWWVVQLIIMVVSALISYATRPKQQAPAKADAKAPNTDDGQMVKHHFGECWVDDSFILAWKVVGTEKIKSKGGKK